MRIASWGGVRMLVAVTSFRLRRGVLCQDVEEWAGQFPCRGERERVATIFF